MFCSAGDVVLELRHVARADLAGHRGSCNAHTVQLGQTLAAASCDRCEARAGEPFVSDRVGARDCTARHLRASRTGSRAGSGLLSRPWASGERGDTAGGADAFERVRQLVVPSASYDHGVRRLVDQQRNLVLGEELGHAGGGVPGYDEIANVQGFALRDGRL